MAMHRIVSAIVRGLVISHVIDALVKRMEYKVIAVIYNLKN
jgi:hypothetical protein